MLCKDTKHRLGIFCLIEGSMHGVKEILAHPWFGKNDYSKFLIKEVVPPEDFLCIQKLNLGHGSA